VEDAIIGVAAERDVRVVAFEPMIQGIVIPLPITRPDAALSFQREHEIWNSL
jgi:hypothetical protein